MSTIFTPEQEGRIRDIVHDEQAATAPEQASDRELSSVCDKVLDVRHRALGIASKPDAR